MRHAWQLVRTSGNLDRTLVTRLRIAAGSEATLHIVRMPSARCDGSGWTVQIEDQRRAGRHPAERASASEQNHLSPLLVDIFVRP